MHGVIETVWVTLETGIMRLDQQGQSASADRDIKRILTEQGGQNGCVVNGFMTIGV